MRMIVTTVAGVLFVAAPVAAQQNDSGRETSNQAAPPRTEATHRQLSPIGQALAGLLREANRPPSPRPSASGAPLATAAAPVPHGVAPAAGDSAPVEVAVH